MPRSEPPPPPPITSTDLGAYIASQDDFAFEREVFHMARGLGLTAEHAGLYEDPVTNKPRQFDIRARADQRATNGRRCRICLTVECKGLTPTYPLLVSCVPRAPSEAFHEELYTDSNLGAGGSFTRVRRRSGANSLYPHGQPVGKAMRQVRKDQRDQLIGGDEVFDKWMQALASAAEMVSDAANVLSAPEDRKPQVITVIPVLVVSDATLWAADYAANGTLNQPPFKVDEITFYLGRKYELPRERTTYTISHLHIETRGHVGAFLEQVGRCGGVWEELFGGDFA